MIFIADDRKNKNRKKFAAALTVLVSLSLILSNFQQSFTDVSATIIPLSVNVEHLDFGTVFPGEELQGNFIVSYVDGGDGINYRLIQKRKPLPPEHPDYPSGGDPDMPGYYRDLCPFLTKVSNEGEGDNENNAFVGPNDTSDTWIVYFEVPAIFGNVAQDHTGGVVTTNGEYGCDISVNIDIDEICDPNKELVINGGFELPEVSHSKKWNIYNSSEVSGWEIAWNSAEPSYKGTPRPADAYLELQRGVNSWLPNEGYQWAELDADWDGPDGSLTGEPASAKIYQDIDTFPGQEYSVTFYFSPRPETGVSNNNLEFSWGGDVKDTISGTGGSNTDWTKYTYSFIATDYMTRLQFAEIGTSDSLGTFLDNVSVRCIPAGPSCIPEGGSAAVVPGALECCPGLTAIGCSAPDEFGVCQECVGAFYCTKCGNGICGLGENKCNCPQDCLTGEPSTWYRDADGDGYGDAGESQSSISQPEGYVSDNTDCDDTNSSINPGAIEVCNNGLDDDCDGNIDCDDSDCINDPNCITPQPECNPDETRPCDTGELGVCAAGTQTCDSEGFWGTCERDTDPSAEICDNGLDDDCDGFTDGDDPNCQNGGPVIRTNGGGGGGGGGPIGLIIFNEENEEVLTNQVTVSWFTSTPATTRVIYDTVSHSSLSAPPNYGYAFSTLEEDSTTKITYHTVTITGLTPGQTYYWRAISHGSPEVWGDELTFTMGTGEEGTGEEEEEEEEGGYVPPYTPPTGGEQEEEEEEGTGGEQEEEEGTGGEQEEEEEEIAEDEKEEGLGLTGFIAAIGNFFTGDNLCWFLTIFATILALLYFLSRRKRREIEDRDNLGIIIGIVILIILAFWLECWLLVIPTIILIILLLSKISKKKPEKI